MHNKCKKSILLIGIFGMLFFLVACSDKGNQELDLEKGENNKENFPQKEGTQEYSKESITFKILGGEEIIVDRKRLGDTDRINNRWSLEEVDAILTPLQGTWKAEKYVGYILSDLYKFEPDDNIGKEMREKLSEEYNEKVRAAENIVPEIQVEIKCEEENVIYVNTYESPFSIILSIARINDYYLIYTDSTTCSESFYVDYPVIYVKVFARFIEEDIEIYKPATVIVSADNQVMILIEGAFYSLVRM